MASYPPRIPLPRHWPEHVKSGFLCAIALAHRGMTFVHGWCENSKLARVRLAANAAELESRVALLEKENRLLRSRLSRVPAAKRPHYLPGDRLEILAVKAAAGLSSAELARRFLVTPLTIASWLRRCDEQGPEALLRMAEPVNKFPDFVRELVRHLKRTCSAMGKVRVSQILARAGLHLAPSTVRRFWQKPDPSVGPPRTPAAEKVPPNRAIIARRGNHVWGIDLSPIPTRLGFWVPWFPGSLANVWPFAWWTAVVMDHYSRRLLAVSVFAKDPSAEEVCCVLDRARRRAGGAPKYTVTDQGAQFQSEYRAWCDRHGVKLRYGAIGKHGSVARVERLIRSLKAEALGGRLVPLALRAMTTAVENWSAWYNEVRPHQGLGGRTPDEVFRGARPAHLRARLEPRARYPARAPCARPHVPVRGCCGARFRLLVSHPVGASHLPAVRLRRAA